MDDATVPGQRRLWAVTLTVRLAVRLAGGKSRSAWLFWAESVVVVAAAPGAPGTCDAGGCVQRIQTGECRDKHCVSKTDISRQTRPCPATFGHHFTGQSLMRYTAPNDLSAREKAVAKSP